MTNEFKFHFNSSTTLEEFLTNLNNDSRFVPGVFQWVSFRQLADGVRLKAEVWMGSCSGRPDAVHFSTTVSAFDVEVWVWVTADGVEVFGTVPANVDVRELLPAFD